MSARADWLRSEGRAAERWKASGLMNSFSSNLRREENYLLFSDVHLGADLVQHAAPWTLSRLKEAARVDRDLTAMLEHYRATRDLERPWCLVIAGDLVDFVGMSIAPADGDLELNEEERIHGVGSASAHAAHKMRAVAARHFRVFEALSAFVAEGHRVVVVRGNHDVEFHWEEAQAAFVDALVTRAKVEHHERIAFEARIEFAPWFYYVEGLLYVEHGHQYDATCSHENQLVPVSPRDPKRIHESFSDVLVRRVVRPTRGLGQDGHDHATFVDYLRIAASVGVSGAIALGRRYVTAIVDLIRSGRELMLEQAKEVRAEHERRMELLATRARIGMDRLRELRAFQVAPVSARAFGVIVALFADRILLGLGLLVCAAMFAVAGLPWWATILGAAPVLGVSIELLRRAMRLRAQVFGQAERLKQTARKIARVLPARFVVMGHTHEPMLERFDESVYVNLGAWAVDELAEGPPKEAPRTHLVIRRVGAKVEAVLARWDTREGALTLSVVCDTP